MHAHHFVMQPWLPALRRRCVLWVAPLGLTRPGQRRNIQGVLSEPRRSDWVDLTKIVWSFE